MKLKGLKGLCAGLALAMLASLAPMNIMATETTVDKVTTNADGSVTITANADTWIGDSATEKVLNKSSIGTISFKNNKTNYMREAWVRFDLNKIPVPAGKCIDTAKITMHLASYSNNKTKDAADVSVYEIKSQEYNPAKITWAYENIDDTTVARTTFKEGKVLDTQKLCPDNTFTAGTAYDFDVSSLLSTDYYDAKGYVSFAFAPVYRVDASFYSLENTVSEEYVPQLTVTFKEMTEQTIKPSADTWIGKAEADVNNESTNVLETKHRGDNHIRYSYVQFDYDSIAVPPGKQIDTAKITLHLYAHKNYNYIPTNKNYSRVGANINMYPTTSEDYVPAEVTWNTGKELINMGYLLAQTKVCPYNTDTDVTAEGYTETAPSEGEPYEFDITDYIRIKESYNALNGKETFAFYTAGNQIETTFFSMNYTDADYAPKLTVTFKELDTQILTPVDIASASDQTSARGDGTTYVLRNQGRTTDGSDSPYNKAAYIMYDLSEINIPEDKVITAAELQLYVKGNGDATGQSIRIHNVKDDSWLGDLSNDTPAVIPWAVAPNASTYRAALDAGVSISGTIPVEDGADYKWYSGDVTEFVTSELVNDNIYGCVSFCAFPHKQDKLDMYMAAMKKGYEPRLVLTFGEESEITVGTPVVTNSLVVDLAETIAKSGATYVHVPVSGASSAPVNAKVYVAQYRASNDELVGVSMVKDLSLTAGQGKLYFSYYPIGDEDDCYVKVFVWDGNMDSVNDAVASVNMYTEAVTE